MKTTFISSKYRPRVKGARIQHTPQSHTTNTVDASASPQTRVVCLGPAQDNVLRLMREEGPSHFIYLYYDSLGSDWTFTLRDDQLLFLTRQGPIRPQSLYLRGAIIDDTAPQWQLFNALLEAVNIPDIKVIGRPNTQSWNESKMAQTLLTIRPSIANTKDNRISFPRSMFVKGDPAFLKSILRSFKDECNSLITKSASGVRSLVVDDSVFSAWPITPLRNLPTLFQEKISGSDVRVHVLNNMAWPLEVKEKSEVDYRYSQTRSEMLPLQLNTEEMQFCNKACEIEKNDFVGIDFVKNGDKYYCLEINPGPGWAWYHNPTIFSHNLLHYLVSFLETPL